MYTPGPGQLPQAQTPAVQEAPQPQAKPKAPGKSKGGDVGAFIQQLIGLMAYVHQLQVQSHLMHLNIEGSNFLGLHKFLKKQYELHIDQFDVIGEFVRSMDYLCPSCHNGLMEASPEFKHCTSYKNTEMLGIYYKNLEELGMKAKKLEPIAAKVGAIDIQNYMSELCGQAFKSAWQVKATLRNS